MDTQQALSLALVTGNSRMSTAHLEPEGPPGLNQPFRLGLGLGLPLPLRASQQKLRVLPSLIATMSSVVRTCQEIFISTYFVCTHISTPRVPRFSPTQDYVLGYHVLLSLDTIYILRSTHTNTSIRNSKAPSSRNWPTRPALSMFYCLEVILAFSEPLILLSRVVSRVHNV